MKNVSYFVITPVYEIMAIVTDKSVNNKKPKKGLHSADTVVTWSIRNVEIEQRAVILKAADKAGKTIGRYINEDIASFCLSQLSHTSAVSAPKDIQNQIDHLTSIIEAIGARMPEQGKKSIWNRLFKS